MRINFRWLNSFEFQLKSSSSGEFRPARLTTDYRLKTRILNVAVKDLTTSSTSTISPDTKLLHCRLQQNTKRPLVMGPERNNVRAHGDYRRRLCFGRHIVRAPLGCQARIKPSASMNINKLNASGLATGDPRKGSSNYASQRSLGRSSC